MSQLLRDDPWIGSESALLSPSRVVAWRRWRLRPGGSGEPLLWSAHEDQVWLSRTLRAECNPSLTWAYRLAEGEEEQRGHVPPAEDCRCGIYAYRTPELARPMGPGVWMDGRVVVGGPMFATEAGYRGREATIDGPLGLKVECSGGDDLYSPTRCFEPPVRIKYGSGSYHPVCSSHRRTPVDVALKGSFDLADFFEVAVLLGTRLETLVITPGSE